MASPRPRPVQLPASLLFPRAVGCTAPHGTAWHRMAPHRTARAHEPGGGILELKLCAEIVRPDECMPSPLPLEPSEHPGPPASSALGSSIGGGRLSVDKDEATWTMRHTSHGRASRRMRACLRNNYMRQTSTAANRHCGEQALRRTGTAANRHCGEQALRRECWDCGAEGAPPSSRANLAGPGPAVPFACLRHALRDGGIIWAHVAEACGTEHQVLATSPATLRAPATVPYTRAPPRRNTGARVSVRSTLIGTSSTNDAPTTTWYLLDGQGTRFVPELGPRKEICRSPPALGLQSWVAASHPYPWSLPNSFHLGGHFPGRAEYVEWLPPLSSSNLFLLSLLPPPLSSSPLVLPPLFLPSSPTTSSYPCTVSMRRIHGPSTSAAVDVDSDDGPAATRRGRPMQHRRIPCRSSRRVETNPSLVARYRDISHMILASHIFPPPVPSRNVGHPCRRLRHPSRSRSPELRELACRGNALPLLPDEAPALHTCDQVTSSSPRPHTDGNQRCWPAAQPARRRARPPSHDLYKPASLAVPPLVLPGVGSRSRHGFRRRLPLAVFRASNAPPVVPPRRRPRRAEAGRHRHDERTSTVQDHGPPRQPVAAHDDAVNQDAQAPPFVLRPTLPSPPLPTDADQDSPR
ncbi:hypothetical protein RJ55_05535 [Drechmeria coniospora]|nr:hypothetical protein RJ55_05535 [Drechmeria coniospora]